MVPTIVIISPHAKAREALVTALNMRCCGCQVVGLRSGDRARVWFYTPVAVVDRRMSFEALTALEAVLVVLSAQPPLITIGPPNPSPDGLDRATEEQLFEPLADVVPSLRRFRSGLRAAAAVVATERRNIVARWVQHLTLMPAFEARPALPLSALKGEGASIIQAMVDALCIRPELLVWFPGARAYASAMAHARLRIQQGIPADVVLQEYQILERELWLAIQSALDRQVPTTPECFGRGERLQSMVTALAAVTIQEYRRHNR